MPNFDGTGPRGEGAMTGGGRGYCAMPAGEVTRQPMSGSFYGRRGGRGRRNCFYATGLPGWMRVQRGMQASGGFSSTLPKKDEVSLLKDQAVYLKSELDAIQARLQNLEGK